MSFFFSFLHRQDSRVPGAYIYPQNGISSGSTLFAKTKSIFKNRNTIFSSFILFFYLLLFFFFFFFFGGGGYNI